MNDKIKSKLTTWVNSLNYQELENLGCELVNAGGFTDIADFQLPIPMAELDVDVEDRAPSFNASQPYFTRVTEADDLAVSYSAAEAKALLKRMILDNLDLVLEAAEPSAAVRDLVAPQLGSDWRSSRG